jgi:hypothetical protein
LRFESLELLNPSSCFLSVQLIMAVSTEPPRDVEKSDITHADHVDASSKDSSAPVGDYAPPENTTLKTWVVIFVRDFDTNFMTPKTDNI